MALSDTAIRKAKAREKSYKLYDENNLFLLVHPKADDKGGKYWRLKYRYAGKERVLALGVYPEVTLAEARDKRDAARRLLRDGIDPSQKKRQDRRQARVDAENSFEVVAREWHAKQRPSWTKDHAERVLVSIEKDVFPRLGSRPIVQITAPEILDVLRVVEKRQALDVAGRVRQRVNAVFRYAIHSGILTHNPAADLAGALKTRKVAHRPALTRAELPEFFGKLSAYDGHELTRLALRLMVLTFVRSGELRGARWTELDTTRAEWRIPAERMKMRELHIVPLSRQALEVIDQLRPLSGHLDVVFPSQNDGDNVMSENTLLYAMYRMGYHKRATVHGWRATASTILNEMGFKPDVIERQLAHAERNKVRAAYHRSQYLEERRAMMQAWADLLDTIADGAEIIPIRGKAA
jgi:integrase